MNTTSQRWSGLDALREMAAWGVLLFHARQETWMGLSEFVRSHRMGFNMESILAIALLPFCYGHVGVSIFFCINGYIIHRIYGMHDHFDAKRFFLRRAKRLYPVYLTAVLLTLAVQYVLVSADGRQGKCWRSFTLILSCSGPGISWP